MNIHNWHWVKSGANTINRVLFWIWPWLESFPFQRHCAPFFNHVPTLLYHSSTVCGDCQVCSHFFFSVTFCLMNCEFVFFSVTLRLMNCKFVFLPTQHSFHLLTDHWSTRAEWWVAWAYTHRNTKWRDRRYFQTKISVKLCQFATTSSNYKMLNWAHFTHRRS